MSSTIGHPSREETLRILNDLVAIPTISVDSNLALIEYVQGYLGRLGILSDITYDADRTKGNLFATLGPQVDGGVILNGHTDVVGVDGQDWSREPFTPERVGSRIHGRGTCDMKGFIACSLALAEGFLALDPERPLHLAFTFDEEIGSLGAPILIERLGTYAFRPASVLVGEPTGLELIAGHKGCYEMATRITGLECHASNPGNGLSAVAYAARMIGEMMRFATELEATPPADSPFDPPGTTLNVGTVVGGTSRNTVAGSCEFLWEVREVDPETARRIIDRIDAYAQRVLLPEMRAAAPQAMIETRIEAYAPALEFRPESPAARLVESLTGREGSGVVPFGSDAGLFQRAGLPTVLVGPGHIDQAHKPDEFIEIGEIDRCLSLLDRLSSTLVPAAESSSS